MTPPDALSDRRAILVFVDGLGLGEADPSVNPLRRGDCPRLLVFLEQHATPLDAGLGVPGLPQSATGQTALLTGLNAARIEGRHVEGFPGSRLKNLIRQHNLFRRLLARGQTATFANAYFTTDLESVKTSRRQSVTTVAALSAFGAVRDRAQLEADEAVYHDLTRTSLLPRGYDGPLIRPHEAATHLLGIAKHQTFTLFEYFQTDRAGHRNDPTFTRAVLAELDEFIGTLLDQATAAGCLLIVTSDHGNIEDCRTRSHTANPSPSPPLDLTLPRCAQTSVVSPMWPRPCSIIWMAVSLVPSARIHGRYGASLSKAKDQAQDILHKHQPQTRIDRRRSSPLHSARANDGMPSGAFMGQRSKAR